MLPDSCWVISWCLLRIICILFWLFRLLWLHTIVTLELENVLVSIDFPVSWRFAYNSKVFLRRQEKFRVTFCTKSAFGIIRGRSLLRIYAGSIFCVCDGTFDVLPRSHMASSEAFKGLSYLPPTLGRRNYESRYTCTQDMFTLLAIYNLFLADIKVRLVFLWLLIFPGKTINQKLCLNFFATNVIGT